MSKTLLIAAHAPSANTSALAEAALRGASNTEAGATRVEIKSPLDIKPADLSDCDGFMIGTTENIGYMAGATKDMFDRCYNEWLDRREGLPVAIYIRAALDGTATRRALESIVGAQRWRLVASPLILHGPWSQDYPLQVEELAMGMAAGLDAGIF